MTIAELRRNTQEFQNSRSQAYVQVNGVLYPVADVELQQDGLIILAGEAITEADEEIDDVVPVSAEPIDETEATTSTEDLIDEAVKAREISKAEGKAVAALEEADAT